MEEIKELEGFDGLNIRNVEEITRQLKNNEVIYFSGHVTKYNRFDWGQERIFLVTNLAIYNIK